MIVSLLGVLGLVPAGAGAVAVARVSGVEGAASVAVPVRATVIGVDNGVDEDEKSLIDGITDGAWMALAYGIVDRGLAELVAS